MSNPYFDSYTPLPRNQLARAEQVNAIIDAIIVGFDRVPATDEIQQDRISFCEDIGPAANQYVINPTFPIDEYIEGQRYSFKALHTNTGGSTVNVSGLGAKGIVRPDGNALLAGDILVGRIVSVQYDGNTFQLMSAPASEVGTVTAAANAAIAAKDTAVASAGTASTDATNAHADALAAAASLSAITSSISPWAIAGGTADAITGTFSPAITTLTDGLVVGFRAASANTSATPTFKANGTAAKTITKGGGQSLAPGDIAVKAELTLRYHLADQHWEIINGLKQPRIFTGSADPAAYAHEDDVWVETP